jgi:hypothetical protein
LAKKVEYVADDVAESGDWTLAKTVETRFFETIKESYKTGQYGVLGPREWDKERFHGVEKPMLEGREDCYGLWTIRCVHDHG